MKNIRLEKVQKIANIKNKQNIIILLNFFFSIYPG